MINEFVLAPAHMSEESFGQKFKKPPTSNICNGVQRSSYSVAGPWGPVSRRPRAARLPEQNNSVVRSCESAKTLPWAYRFLGTTNQ